MNPQNYIFNTFEDVQVAGRMEYSTNPKYIVRNTSTLNNPTFYSKLLPQFPQLENERTMKIKQDTEPCVSFKSVIISPIDTVKRIYFGNFDITDNSNIIGFGMFFIYLNFILNK